MKNSYKYSTLFIVLYYAIFGVIWALASETLLSLHPDWTTFEALDQIVLVIISLFVLYLLIRREISERKKAEEVLIQADRIKTDFMSMVSHELRTPLTAIQGFVSLLDQETFGPLTAVQKDFIAKIKTQSAHLYHLLTSVLDFTSLEYGGKFEIKKEPVNLLAQVNESLEAMRPDFDKKEIKLVINIPEDFPTIISDEAKIERVLANLLGNAFKFTPRRGSVTIDARTDNENLIFSVRDTGIGIAKEFQAKIFDKFYQVDSSITRGYGGIGMGLAIAREIVQALGGQIRVESEEGKGATFTVTVPKK